MKQWFWRITTLIAASALLTFATLIKSDYEYVHASKWDPAVPLHESTAFRITLWGWPMRFVSDSPLSDRWEALDFGDEFHLTSFILDWGLWLMGLSSAGGMGALLFKALSDRTKTMAGSQPSKPGSGKPPDR